MYDGIVQDLIDEFGRLPGIGPKSAQRIAFHILQTESFDPSRLSELLADVKERVRFCEICGNVTFGGPKRNPQDVDPLACMVEDQSVQPRLTWQTISVLRDGIKQLIFILRRRSASLQNGQACFGMGQMLAQFLQPASSVNPGSLCKPLPDRLRFQQQSRNLRFGGRFQPATPTFLNTAKAQRGELVSCFLLRIEDNMESISRGFNSSLQLSKRGGGVALLLQKPRRRPQAALVAALPVQV